MLSRIQLREYGNWVGKSPVYVRDSVIQAGGWHEVFPAKEELPVWAHRIRNFFNQTPGMLKRLPGAYRPKGYRKLITPFSLTGDAYLDPAGIIWYQMTTVATIYHYPGEVGKLKKFDAATKLQAFLPVFKFISPDDTDGSLELIVHNYMTNYIPSVVDIPGVTEWGENTLGAVNEWTNIAYRTEFKKAYEGSYNYAETVMRGYDDHKHYDVRTHENYGGFYITPVHPWTKIGDRRFPAQAHHVMGRGA